MIASHASVTQTTVSARTFSRRYSTASQAVLLDCDDGHSYVVKALRSDTNQGRMLFNDWVCAKIGDVMSSPVPIVEFVDVPASLIALNPDSAGQMGHLIAGIAHGSRLIGNVTERIDSLDPTHLDVNAERFAHLAVFSALLHGSDRQFIYETVSPFRVYSHDHGHYFPGGPNWNSASLASAPPPDFDESWLTPLGLKRIDLSAAVAGLRPLTDEKVAEIVAKPPDSWGVAKSERADLARFVSSRRDALLSRELN